MSITLDIKDVRRFEGYLKTFNRRAIPFANRNALNDTAFDARREAIAGINKKFTTRNKWTVKSIRVNKAVGTNVRTMRAETGSTLGYMADQEFGGTKKPKKGKSVAIQTGYSSGEGNAARPRKRLPRKANKMANIALKRGRKGKNSRQRNAIAVRSAAKSGRKYVYLSGLRGKKKSGIFRVLGGKKKPSVSRSMVADLSQGSVKIKRKPWLAPAAMKAGSKMQKNYSKRLQEQVKRHRLFVNR